ncbi:zinc ribbon domain-containing protein [Actinomyces sp. W5033]|uniref:zinc ribbon domain-containing protein n=1 Tax=Actinomyces sp. W5033 TaxID=3446479 RepID=UPI003EE36C41
MTSAPLSDQRLLIDLQRLDSQLARLVHERRGLPVLARIEATVGALRTNKRDAVVAAAALAEARRESARADEEVAQVVRRAAALRERLSSGTAAARDLSAIQGEIDQLGRRQGVLEEAQLAAMEALDNAQAEVERLAQAEQEVRATGRGLTAERDAEFARIDAALQDTQSRRDALAATIPAALLAEYDDVRRATGGLGAVALYGRRVDGNVEISPQEHARIAAAPQDQVIHAEDNDVILVRMED